MFFQNIVIKKNCALNFKLKSQVFQLQLDKFKLSLSEQFSSFKQSFITEVLQIKSEFLRKESTGSDENTTEKLFHQMEKEITFQHEDLKSKNIIITLLLQNLVKLKDNHHNENRSVHSNDDVKVTHSEKNNTTATQLIETMETEMTSTDSQK